MQNTIGNLLAGEKGHGHAAPRIDAAADKEEVFETIAFFGGLETEILPAMGNHPIDRPPMRIVDPLDILRCPHLLNHDMLPQAVESHPFEFVQNPFFQLAVVSGSEGGILQVRDVGEDLEVLAPGRRLARIGAGRSDQIDGRVVGETPVPEDRLEVLPGIIGIEEIVVSKLG